MKEFIEKLVSRLEEKLNESEEIYQGFLDEGDLPCLLNISDVAGERVDTIKEIIEIVNKLAAECKVPEMQTPWKQNMMEKFERVE